MTEKQHTRTMLPRYREGDNPPGAGHINKLSEAAEHVYRQGAGGYSLRNGYLATPLPPFYQEPLIIVEEGCDGNEDHYLVKRRYFDADSGDGEWKTDESSDGYCLDPTDFDLSFEVDDKVHGYWHEQSQKFLPIAVSSGGGSPTGGCCGDCLETGDREIDDIITVGTWRYSHVRTTMKVTGGYITLPAKTYSLAIVDETLVWTLDVTDDLIASGPAGEPSTDLLTGEAASITFEVDANDMKLTVHIEGEIA